MFVLSFGFWEKEKNTIENYLNHNFIYGIYL